MNSTLNFRVAISCKMLQEASFFHADVLGYGVQGITALNDPIHTVTIDQQNHEHLSNLSAP